ncbi:unnamed protein product [Staurois parvus]|uniref:Uncharacterized protein n=1 Tax=Staurois parvus TaxID=386267 RepID=A0ABN9ETH2_9NEOB|nr:unnamed protein product [Staurois parvus]
MSPPGNRDHGAPVSLPTLKNHIGIIGGRRLQRHSYTGQKGVKQAAEAHPHRRIG